MVVSPIQNESFRLVVTCIGRAEPTRLDTALIDAGCGGTLSSSYTQRNPNNWLVCTKLSPGRSSSWSGMVAVMGLLVLVNAMMFVVVSTL